MQHTEINQTQLVHDLISLQSGFTITSSITGIDPLEYQWLLVEKTAGNEEVVASCLDQTWVGIKAS